MVKVSDNEIQIPVIMTPTKSGYTMYVPDLKYEVHGADLVETMALGIMYTSAVYFYNLERNYHFKLTTTYEEAERMCKKRKSFVTYIGIVK